MYSVKESEESEGSEEISLVETKKRTTATFNTTGDDALTGKDDSENAES